MACPLAAERVWAEKSACSDAELRFHQDFNQCKPLLGKNSKLEDTAECCEDRFFLGQPTLCSKSPVKKTRKNKKEKKAAAVSQVLSPEVTTDQSTNESTPPSVPAVHQTKNKKDKTNALKQVGQDNVNDNGPIKIDESTATNGDSKITEIKKKNSKRGPKKSAIGTVERIGSAASDDAVSITTPPNVEATQNQDNPVTVAPVKKEKKQKKKLAQTLYKQHQETLEQVGRQQEVLLSAEIAKLRQQMQESLECADSVAALASNPKNIIARMNRLDAENTNLREAVEELKKAQQESNQRILQLEARLNSLVISCGAKPAPAPAAAAASKASDDDDGVDLFGSDSEDEDEAAAKVREQRLAEYASKKSKKTAIIAKSNIILDIKPWDDETNLNELEKEVRKIKQEGLLWGVSKQVPIAYGILKLQISCVVEDDKVSIDELTENLEAIEEYVQSVDIVAFNKI